VAFAVYAAFAVFAAFAANYQTVYGGICGVVDARLPPQVSLVVEALSCGGVLPLRSCIPRQLLGACRVHHW
jgi:hypothetical protein